MALLKTFHLSIQVEFQIPAVTVGDSPHKDSICRIANFNDGAMVTCSSVRNSAYKIYVHHTSLQTSFNMCLSLGWRRLFLVSQADTKAHKKGELKRKASQILWFI